MTYPDIYPTLSINGPSGRFLWSWEEMFHELDWFYWRRKQVESLLFSYQERAAGRFDKFPPDPHLEIVFSFFLDWKRNDYFKLTGMKQLQSLVDRCVVFERRDSKRWVGGHGYDSAVRRLAEFSELLEIELRERSLYLVTNAKRDLYESAVEPEISASFPSAVWDLQEADRCFALDRYVASVYHLMRATEYAMRALATSLGVRRIRPCLEQEDWSVIIQQIETQSQKKVIDKLSGIENKDVRATARQFFRSTTADLWAFKDDVRNLVMHASTKKYDEPGALNVRNRVYEFLHRVAVRVSENGQKLTKSSFRR